MDSSTGSPNLDSTAKTKAAGILEKAVVILKKKALALTDKELNLEFFQKLERRGSDVPVEVVVAHRCLTTLSSNKEETEASIKDSKESVGNVPNDYFRGSSNNKSCILDRGNDGNSRQWDFNDFTQDRYFENGMNARESRTKAYDTDDRIEINQRDGSANHAGFFKTKGQSDGSFINNRGNWLAIHRQLLQLEK